MNAYLSNVWGQADYQQISQPDITNITATLNGRCAIFASRGPGDGHSGVLIQGAYHDPYIDDEITNGHLIIDVWVLNP